MTPVLAFVGISVALIVGKLVRLAVPALRRYFIPASILGGTFALLLGPEVWGRLDPGREAGLFGQEVFDLWRTLPGFLINVVFAALFLGKAIPGLKEVWRRAGPQVAFGQTIAWGQYVIGIGVTLAILVPLFGVPPMFGALLEIGFEGGHGTAAGLGPTFAEVGWEEGQDLALGVATVGVVMGVVLGMILVNWAIRKGHTKIVTSEGRATVERGRAADADEAMEDREGLESGLQSEASAVAAEGAPNEKRKTIDLESVEPLAFHMAYIGAAIGAGWLLQQALVWLESVTLVRLGAPALLEHIPLFPLAMIGGIVVQKLRDRLVPGLALDRAMISKIQGMALDFLIVSAMATLTLSALAANWQPLSILILAGLVWNVSAFLILARRMIPTFWVERGIGDFGQSLGMTATGLLLMRVVDPDRETPAFDAFGYKQLLFEPFVGGGLVTAISVPLIVTFGPWPLFILSSVLLAASLFVGLVVFGRDRGGGQGSAAAGEDASQRAVGGT
jgi:glutamate:Na+ symporter, ESS family